MIQFSILTAIAVSSKFLGMTYYIPASTGLAAVLFFSRYFLQKPYRERTELFLLHFGVLNYTLANRDPSYCEQLSLIFCVVPSFEMIKSIGRLAKAESTCALLLAYMLWSFVWTANSSMTLAGLFMSFVCLCFIFGYVIQCQGNLTRLFHFLMMVISVLAVSSIIMGILGYGFVGHTFAGVTFHRNQFGFLLGLALLLGLFSIHWRLDWHTGARLIGLVSGSVLFFYVDSKSALIGFTLTCIVWFIARSRWRRVWLSLAILSAIIFFVSLPTPKIDHFALWVGRDPSFTGRTTIWTDSLNLLVEQPFTGFGYNATWHAFENRLSQYPHAPGPKYAHAHNAMIEWGLHLGIGGLFLYLVFLGTLLIRACQWARINGDTHLPWQAVSVLVYVEVYNLANVSNIPINRFGFFILATITVCLWLNLTTTNNQLREEKKCALQPRAKPQVSCKKDRHEHQKISH